MADSSRRSNPRPPTTLGRVGPHYWYDASAGRSASSRPRSTTIANFPILIVDEVETNRRILGLQLHAWGLVAEMAGDAEEAVFLAHAARQRGEPFGVILSEFQLPGADGIELAKSVAPTPVVIMSSAGGREEARWRSPANVGAWLVKPPRRSQLFDSLATCLQASSTGRSAASDHAPAVGSSGHLLVAFGGFENQLHAVLLLTEAGYFVDTVANGAEAVDAFDRVPYDAIMMDCDIAVMDGYVAASEIRRREGPDRHVPIVAVTDSALQQDLDRALAAGMDAHLPKPVDWMVLSNTLARLLLNPQLGSGGLVPPPPFGVLHSPALDQLQALDEHGEGLREIVHLFLRDAPRQMRQIVEAVARSDADAVHLSAHNLKGTSSTVGATGLEALCAGIEHTSGEGHLPDEATMTSVRAALQSAMAALESEVIRRSLP